MSFIAESLADFAVSLSSEAIPQYVRQRAAYLMLDAAGIAHASTTFEFARQAAGAVSTFEGGACPVIGLPMKLALRDAVLLNGILVHGLDFDDTHQAGVVHVSSSCFPAALGAAWAARRSGSEMLTAYVLGIEVAARLGAVARSELNQIGFHPTGVIAAFACALIAGKLEGLTRDQLVMAQGIVLSMAAGTREYSTDGSSTKRMHPGWAGVCGITAARLARAGFTGPRSAYEGQFGLYATHLGADRTQWDLPAALSGLGSKWETAEVGIKAFPICNLSIACVDVAIALVSQHPIVPAEVESIEVLVPPQSVKIICEPLAEKKRPAGSYAAQFSLPFVVACGLIHGKCGLAEIERYNDPDILALADKVRYRLDPLTGYPRHVSGEVIVTFRNGTRISHREQIHRGAAENPISDADIVEKFTANMMLASTPEHAERVRDTIINIDTLDDARNLADTLNAAPVRA